MVGALPEFLKGIAQKKGRRADVAYINKFIADDAGTSGAGASGRGSSGTAGASGAGASGKGSSGKRARGKGKGKGKGKTARGKGKTRKGKRKRRTDSDGDEDDEDDDDDSDDDNDKDGTNDAQSVGGVQLHVIEDHMLEKYIRPVAEMSQGVDISIVDPIWNNQRERFAASDYHQDGWCV